MPSSIEKVTISHSHETGAKIKPPVGEPEGYMPKWYRFCMFGGMGPQKPGCTVFQGL